MAIIGIKRHYCKKCKKELIGWNHFQLHYRMGYGASCWKSLSKTKRWLVKWLS